MTPAPAGRKARLRAAGTVLLLFLLSLGIRLPNLNRPVSKHYEFNTAVILINTISWRQAGGGDRFYYTPVMNFQHPGDKLPPNNLYIDKSGNSVYLSFGPGWYLIPYFIYQCFQLPASPVYLQIINLIFHFVAILLFFRLLEKLIPEGRSHKYFMVIAGCCGMIFSPGMLWFLGNGYVNTGILLPFVLGALLVLLPMIRDPGMIGAGRLCALAALVLALIYIDWFVVFLGLLSGLVILIKSRQNRKYLVLLAVIALAGCAGAALIFFQFAAHMGPKAVVDYWLRRSAERSLNLDGVSWAKKMAFLCSYFLSAYGPLLLLLAGAWLYRRRWRISLDWSKNEVFFLRLYGATLVFYNALLFEWSADHEFTVLPWSILLSFAAARHLGLMKNRRLARALLMLFIACSTVQYYWINRPGKISRDGMPYASFQQLGISLRKIPPDYSLCMNIEQNPMVEYYAGRNILRAPDSLSVRARLKELGIKKAVWITQRHDSVLHIQPLP